MGKETQGPPAAGSSVGGPGKLRSGPSAAGVEEKPTPRLLDRVRAVIRTRHMSFRTEETYVAWIRRFILFHGKRHPVELGSEEISAFLTHLAVTGKVASSTQNQALSALAFLYREVLRCDFPEPGEILRARRPVHLPVVFTMAEAKGVLDELGGTHRLMAALLYGAGLRLMECVRLRVKDIDFGYRQLQVRDGKGRRDRATVLPDSLVEPLEKQIERVRQLFEEDLRSGRGGASIPDGPGAAPPCERDGASTRGGNAVRSPLDLTA